MKWRCDKIMRRADGSMCPSGGMLAAGMMMLYFGLAIWLTVRITNALETLAMTSALDGMEEDLTDEEKRELGVRVRENLDV